MTLAIERRPFDDALVVALVEELQVEFTVRYGGPDETTVAASDFAHPAGAFFVGLEDGAPVALGGWRFRPDVLALGGSVSAEIKRMYVVPRAQRRGHARAVLAHLEATAAEAGADTMILETGLEQPEAIALYESAGYQPIEPFGYYRGSPLARCFARRL